MALVMTVVLFTTIGTAVLSSIAPRRGGSRVESLAEAFLAGVASTGLLGFALGTAGIPVGAATWYVALFAAVAILIVRRRRVEEGHDSVYRSGPPLALASPTFLSRSQRPARAPAVLESLLLIAALIPTAIVLLDAAVLPLHDYDGRTFWMVKAKAIATERSITGPFFDGDGTENIHSRYPLLMPIAASAVLSVCGTLDDRSVRWLYVLLALCFALVLRRAVRESAGRLLSAITFALLLWLPQFSFADDGGATSAYSDIAIAAFVCLAFFDVIKRELPWTFGLWCAALVLTKNEGLPLAMVLVAVALVLHRWAAVRRGPWLPAMAFALLSIWRSTVPLEHDENYALLARSLPERMSALVPATRELLLRAFDLQVWGLFWIAVVVGGFFAMRANRREASAAIVLIIGALGSVIAAYAVTNWIVADLADSSAHRLLLQIVGPALYLLAIGFSAREQQTPVSAGSDASRASRRRSSLP